MDDFGVSQPIREAVFSAQMALRSNLRDSLRTGVHLGRLLKQAKAECRHGDFGNWLKLHFEGTPRHAQNYMLLSDEYSDPDAVPQLSLREALRLIAGRRKQEEKVSSWERISVETCDAASRTLERIAELIEKEVMAHLWAEGLTNNHTVMKAAKKAERAVKGLNVCLALYAARTQAEDDAFAVAAEIIGVDWPCSDDELDAGYRNKAKVLHPDKGGSPEKFKTLQNAYELLKAAMAAGV